MLLNRFKMWWTHLWRREWPRSRKVQLPELTYAERQALCAQLADHPGWQYIMARLENNKAAAESRREYLVRNIALDAPAEPLVRELIRTDEAIRWLGSIQHTVTRAGAMPPLIDAPDHKSL